MRPTRANLSTALAVTAAVLATATLGVVGITPPAGALSNTSCQGDIALIRVRGSGDQRAGDADLNRPGQEGNSGKQLTLDAFSKALRARAKAAGLSVNEYDLSYPALSTGTISDDLKHIHLLDSKYLDSVHQGEANLTTILTAKRVCTKQRLVLAGYSQGALVVGNVVKSLSASDASRINGIALFGDPKFDPADPAARGSYDPSRYGIIGKRQIGDVFGSRAVNYCYDDDLICQGVDPGARSAFEVGNFGLVRAVLDQQKNAHARGYACVAIPSDSACRSYVDAGKRSMARDGGNYIADLLGLRTPSPTPPPTGSSGKVDLVFAIDTTGSMSPYIQGVVNVANDVVNKLAAKGVDYRIGLVDYKDADHCGDYDAVTDLAFSTDKTAITNAIGSLPGKVSGGCDTPEDVYSGLMRAIGFPWRNGVTKAVIVMGDAPPIDPEPHTGFTAASVAAAAKAVDPANVYPILVGNDTDATAAFTKLATDTNGQTFDSNASDVGQAVLDAIDVIISSGPPPCTINLKGDVLSPLVVNNGDSVCLTNSRVAQGITVEPGGALSIASSQVIGGIKSDGAVYVSACGTVVAPNARGDAVTIDNSSGQVRLGEDGADCAGDTVGGNVRLTNNRRSVTLNQDRIGGSLIASDNSGGVTISANTIASAACTGNDPAPGNGGKPNTIIGASSGQCAGL